MKIEDYTPNAICQAMGMTGFTDLSIGLDYTEALRIVMCPSFHPELCITFRRSAYTSIDMQVTVLMKSFWYQEYPGVLPRASESSEFPRNLFDKIADRFALAVKRASIIKETAVIDGMPFFAVHAIRDKCIEVKGNAAMEDPGCEFILDAVRESYIHLSVPDCINGVFQASKYVGVELPAPKSGAKSLSGNLLVLGTSDAKTGYFEAINRAMENRYKNKE